MTRPGARRVLAMLCTMTKMRPTASHRYLIVRHGETNQNAAGILQGSSDVSRLTAKGHEQARLLGIALADQPDLSNPDRVFVSPLSRARQTLDGLTASSGVALPPATVLSDLREIDLGAWENWDKLDIKASDPVAYDAWQSDPLAFMVEGGGVMADRATFKPVVELWARARIAWAAIKQDAKGSSGSSELTLVVCHNGCGQALLATALGLDETTFRKFPFPNCGAAELEWDGAAGSARWRWRLPPEAADMEWRDGPP